jgi:hypothetical protein
LKEFSCLSGGSNRGPLACESDVLTTTLSDLVVKVMIQLTLMKEIYAQCQFEQEHSAQWEENPTKLPKINSLH